MIKNKELINLANQILSFNVLQLPRDSYWSCGIKVEVELHSIGHPFFETKSSKKFLINFNDKK